MSTSSCSRSAHDCSCLEGMGSPKYGSSGTQSSLDMGCHRGCHMWKQAVWLMGNGKQRRAGVPWATSSPQRAFLASPLGSLLGPLLMLRPLPCPRIEVDDRTEAYLRVLQQKVTSDTQIVSSCRGRLPRARRQVSTGDRAVLSVCRWSVCCPVTARTSTTPSRSTSAQTARPRASAW